MTRRPPGHEHPVVHNIRTLTETDIRKIAVALDRGLEAPLDT
jgi:hypothetical protein